MGIYKYENSKLPYQDRENVSVYCDEIFQNKIKEDIEKSSFGKTHKVIFIEDKEKADFVITDKITISDENYERIGWSPLVVAMDNDNKKIKELKKSKYIVKTEEDGYEINFKKIINTTISGESKYKIYCPKEDTREGKLFKEFLLITINGGSYPKGDTLQRCIEKANEFMESDLVIELNSTERLKSNKKVKNELYILFENELINLKSCDFVLAYPTNTIVHEWYYKININDNEFERVILNKKHWFYSYTLIEEQFTKNQIRCENHTERYDQDVFSAYTDYKIQDNFSYVDIPLKEE